MSVYTALWVFQLERIERDYPHVYGILNNKQRTRNVKVLAQYAALFEKVVACVCVCECEACVNVNLTLLVSPHSHNLVLSTT